MYPRFRVFWAPQRHPLLGDTTRHDQSLTPVPPTVVHLFLSIMVLCHFSDGFDGSHFSSKCNSKACENSAEGTASDTSTSHFHWLAASSPPLTLALIQKVLVNCLPSLFLFFFFFCLLRGIMTSCFVVSDWKMIYGHCAMPGTQVACPD